MDLIRQLLVRLRAILLQSGQNLDVESVETGDFRGIPAGRMAASLGRLLSGRHPCGLNVCNATNHIC
jgi:hypothetical protein